MIDFEFAITSQNEESKKLGVESIEHDESENYFLVMHKYQFNT